MSEPDLRDVLKSQEKYAPDVDEIQTSIRSGESSISSPRTGGSLFHRPRKRIWSAIAVAASVIIVATTATILVDDAKSSHPDAAQGDPRTTNLENNTPRATTNLDSSDSNLPVASMTRLDPSEQNEVALPLIVGTYNLVLIQREGDPTLITDTSAPSLIIREDHTLSANDGCNDLTGHFTQTGNTLHFKPIGQTLIACLGPSQILSIADQKLYDEWHSRDAMQIDVATGTLTTDIAGVQFLYELNTGDHG